MLARLDVKLIDVGGTLLKEFKGFGSCAIAGPDDARKFPIACRHRRSDGTGQITK